MRLLFHMKAISKNDSFVDEFLQHFLFKKWVISINYKSGNRKDEDSTAAEPGIDI